MVHLYVEKLTTNKSSCGGSSLKIQILKRSDKLLSSTFWKNRMQNKNMKKIKHKR